MNCVHCSEPLRPWESVQVVHTAYGDVQPDAACDECYRAFPWRPGDPAALERLVRGTVDPVAVAELAEAFA